MPSVLALRFLVPLRALAGPGLRALCAAALAAAVLAWGAPAARADTIPVKFAELRVEEGEVLLNAEFEFTLNYPGVFMYHCGTPMILEHIASGMYGVVVVEPREGYPTKVDREYVVIQSEFYVKPDPGKRKVGKAPLYVLDGDMIQMIARVDGRVTYETVLNSEVTAPLLTALWLQVEKP